MSRQTGSLAVLGLAVLCFVLGIAVDRTLLRPDPAPPPPYLAQLEQQLGLRPDQISSIAGILDEEDTRLESLASPHMDDMRLAVGELRLETDERILAELDDEQRQRWNELAAR